MNILDSIVFIYVLQRISDKVYLYIGSAINPSIRFSQHRRENRYPLVRDAFSKDDIRFLVISQTDKDHRIEEESKFWKQFKAAGHPIANRDPKQSWNKHGIKTPWNKGKHHSEATRRKISSSHKGLSPDETTRLKMSESHKGKKRKPHSIETRAKLSHARKGQSHPQTKETRLKQSEAAKRRWTRKHNEDHEWKKP